MTDLLDQRCVGVTRVLSAVISKSKGHEHLAHVSDVLDYFLFTLLYTLQNNCQTTVWSTM